TLLGAGLRERRWQVVGEDGAVGRQDGALADVLQLADISQARRMPTDTAVPRWTVGSSSWTVCAARDRGRRCDRTASQTRPQALTRLGRGPCAQEPVGPACPVRESLS